MLSINMSANNFQQFILEGHISKLLSTLTLIQTFSKSCMPAGESNKVKNINHAVKMQQMLYDHAKYTATSLLRSSWVPQTNPCYTRVKWRHSNLWSQYDLYVWGNTEYCVKFSNKDLLHYSNKTESDGLRKCLCYHYLTKKVMSQ